MATLRRTAARLAANGAHQQTRTLVRPAFALYERPAVPALQRPQSAFAFLRHHSAPASNSKVYAFDQIKELTESPSSDRILIGTSPKPTISSVLLTLYTRCTRTFRVPRRLHTRRYQHPHQVAARCALPTCRGVRGPLRLQQALGGKGSSVLLQVWRAE